MSSFLGRLSSRFRQDASYISPPTWLTATTKNKPPTFIPDLIQQEVTNVEDIYHLDKVARKDPIAQFATYGVAKEAMNDGFVLTDRNGDESSKNIKIQRELRILRAEDVITLACAYALATGTGYVYTGKNRYVPKTPEGGRLASLQAFSPLTCNVKKYSEVGVPLSMEVVVNVGEGDYTTREMKLTLPAEDFIFVVLDPLENNPYQGRSTLEAVWDDLTDLRYIVHAMSWYDMKIGNGMFYVVTRTGIPDTFITRMNTSLEDHSVKRAMVFDGQHVEKFGFEGPQAGATDFPEHIDACLQRISAGLGIPKDVLVGATGGTNEAATASEKAAFRRISEVRKDMEYVWREVIKRSGFDITEELFRWNERFAHDEEQRSKIGMNDAQANTTKLTYMTIDEVRKELGLEPLPEGRGDKLSSETSSFNMNVQGFGNENPPSEEAEQTQNPGGEQV